MLGPCAGAAPPEPPSSESGRTAASPSGKDLDRPHTPVSPTAAADTIVDAGPGGEGSEEADPTGVAPSTVANATMPAETNDEGSSVAPRTSHDGITATAGSTLPSTDASIQKPPASDTNLKEREGTDPEKAPESPQPAAPKPEAPQPTTEIQRTRAATPTTTENKPKPATVTEQNGASTPATFTSTSTTTTVSTTGQTTQAPTPGPTTPNVTGSKPSEASSYVVSTMTVASAILLGFMAL